MVGDGEIIIGLVPLDLHVATDWTIPITVGINGTASGMASLMDVRITHHYAMCLLYLGYISYLLPDLENHLLAGGGYCHSLCGDKFVK